MTGLYSLFRIVSLADLPLRKLFITKEEEMKKGMKLRHNGEIKTVENYEARWSMALPKIPHILWIKWHGENKFEKFQSDETGDFADLETVG